MGIKGQKQCPLCMLHYPFNFFNGSDCKYCDKAQSDFHKELGEEGFKSLPDREGK